MSEFTEKVRGSEMGVNRSTTQVMPSSASLLEVSKPCSLSELSSQVFEVSRQLKPARTLPRSLLGCQPARFRPAGASVVGRLAGGFLAVAVIPAHHALRGDLSSLKRHVFAVLLFEDYDRLPLSFYGF